MRGRESRQQSVPSERRERQKRFQKLLCMRTKKKIKNFNRCVEAVIPYDQLKMTDQRRVLRLKLLLNSADIASKQLGGLGS